MPKNYINTGFVPGASEYANTEDPRHVATTSFTGKSASVRVGTATQRMTSAALTIVEPFGVVSCDNQCEVGQLNQSIKVQINAKYGDSQAITSMRAELNRLLDIWQANNMAYGVVPPVDTNLNP